LPKLNIRQTGGNSPNLVALLWNKEAQQKMSPLFVVIKLGGGFYESAVGRISGINKRSSGTNLKKIKYVELLFVIESKSYCP
jgi:hypothetical protein